jgi:predicted component of type VI protein secretion system
MDNTSKIPTERIDVLDNKLTNIDNTLVSLQQSILDLNTRLEEVNTNLTSLINNNYTDLNSKITALQTRATNLEARRYVTTSFTNGTSWYRLYSDKWIEQGGQIAISSDGTVVNLLKTMANTNYYVGANGMSSARYVSCHTKTTASFKCYTGDDSSFNSATICWYVQGLSA